MKRSVNSANPAKSQPIVLAVGEVLWDLLPSGRQLGGAPVNFAYHSAMCGAQSYAVSAVGDDPPGREIVSRLDAIGIDRQNVAISPAHPTSTVTVALDSRGKPHYTIHEDVAWDNLSETSALMALARRADVIYFGTLAQRSAVSRSTIRNVLTAAPQTCLRVLDINLRLDYYSDEILEESLRRCDVLKLNDEELPVLARLAGIAGSEQSVLQRLLDRYRLKLVALTRGSHGAALLAPHGCSVHTGVPAKVADTVGAGDAFTAAVTMGLLHGDSLDEINEQANRLASYVCGQHGAVPPAPPAAKFRADPTSGRPGYTPNMVTPTMAQQSLVRPTMNSNQ